MKQRLFSPTVLLVLLVLASAAPLRGQPALEGRVIGRIIMEVPSGMDASHLRSSLRSREGDIYDRATIQADIATLYAMGEFSSVQVEPAVVEEKVEVTFRITGRPRIQGVEFTGDVQESRSTLDGLLQAKTGAVANPYNLKTDLRLLQDHYQDAGYLFADVRQDVSDAPGGAKVTYSIQAGPKVKLESIEFQGNDPVPADELRKTMLYSKEGGFERGRFDWQFLRSDLLSVRELIRRKGYLDATVGHKVLFDDPKERAHVLVQVELGPMYRVSALTLRVSGVTPDVIPDEKTLVIPLATLRGAMVTREGAPYSQEQLDKDTQAIRDLYGRLGYIKARVDVARTFAENKPEVELRVSVAEGPKVYVNRVLIKGNPVTKDHVIRRAITLIPGSLFTTTEMEESRRALLNTGLFSRSSLDPNEQSVRIRWVDTDQPDKVDAIVEVIEGGVGSFNVGASFSSDTGLAANLSLIYSNFDALDFPRSWRQLFKGRAFVGGGQKLTLSLTPGDVYRDYRLSWLNPSVWDSPYFVGFDLYLHDFIWDGYYEDSRKGASVSVGRNFFKDLSVSLTPKVEDILIHSVDDGAPEDAEDAKGSHTRNSLTLSAKYDKRDNVFLPAKGYDVGVEAEMAGTVLGGDVNSMRETLEARKWWTVWTQENREKHTVNLGGELSLMQSTGSGGVPIFDRLYGGGLGSIRGFRFRGIGPVDSVHEKQVGGLYRLLVNSEYEIPIVREILRGVLFVDSGSVADSVSGLGDLRAAAGFGFRVRIPGLTDQRIPISVYLAFPFEKKETDKTEVFSFTIGTGFTF